MNILGIETSCDETAAAVVTNGQKLRSNVVKSQIDIHAEYGGVVPEIAARSHIEVILPVIHKSLAEADMTWQDIDAIAVTSSPGLVGSLLVGTLTARTLSLLHNKPLYPIHHVKAHVYANFLLEKQPEFPILALIVSGGHSLLVLFESHEKYQVLGQTQDDAVGEAFDKVAKILGLPYPGGPSISESAKVGNPNKYSLPKSKMQNQYDFSFSGLKTAVLRSVQHEVGVDFRFPSHQLADKISSEQQADFAASFQKTAVETLVDATEKAFKQFSPKTVVIAGGVAANQELRNQLKHRLKIYINYPPMELCTDNAAMIASLAYYQSKTHKPVSPHLLETAPSSQL